LQVVIVDGNNTATEEEKLNKDGDEDTANMNEYVLLCSSLMFMQFIMIIRQSKCPHGHGIYPLVLVSHA